MFTILAVTSKRVIFYYTDCNVR